MYLESPRSSCSKWLHMSQTQESETVLHSETLPKTSGVVQNTWNSDKSDKIILSKNRPVLDHRYQAASDRRPISFPLSGFHIGSGSENGCVYNTCARRWALSSEDTYAPFRLPGYLADEMVFVNCNGSIREICSCQFCVGSPNITNKKFHLIPLFFESGENKRINRSGNRMAGYPASNVIQAPPEYIDISARQHSL